MFERVDLLVVKQVSKLKRSSANINMTGQDSPDANIVDPTSPKNRAIGGLPTCV